jgi:hypothetical protein
MEKANDWWVVDCVDSAVGHAVLPDRHIAVGNINGINRIINGTSTARRHDEVPG